MRNLLRQNKDALERSPDTDPAHTPLFKAVSLEHVGCVRLLIEAGATLVQVYTAFIYEGPWLPSRLARGLAEKGV